MAKQFSAIDATLREFILKQHIFFNASAAAEGRVNISPRGLDSLRVLGPNEVIFLDRTGSGNETAAHSKVDGRLTLMFCSFEGPPRILRLYGHSRIIRRGSPDYDSLLHAEFGGSEPPGARQIVALDIEMVQTSCGYGVPLFSFVGDRPTLDRWAEAKGPDGIDAYWREKNLRSIDGFASGMFEEEPAE
jgi:hypothetical protein